MTAEVTPDASSPGVARDGVSPVVAASPPLWRRLTPFVLAAALITYVFTRIDWPTFVDALLLVNYPAFAGVMTLFLVGLLTADTFATVHIYQRVARVTFRDLFVVRAASYLPSILNHHAGQAWLTYLLSRAYGVSITEAAGATLLSYVTWGGCLLLLASGAFAAAGASWWWVAGPIVLGLAYLLLLLANPRSVRRFPLLAPLFEVGAAGHVKAMALRLPHLMVLFMGTWIPFFFFDVNIPLRDAITYIPILMVAVALPLTPVGLGARDSLAAEFLQPYVAGAATAEARIAALAASTMCVAVMLTLLDAVIGLMFMRSATRLLQAERKELRPNLQ